MRNRRHISSLTAATLVLTGLSFASAGAATNINDMLTANYEGAQWSLKSVRAADAWGVATGDGVVVSLIDSGVDANHPDLQGQLLDGASMTIGWDGDGNPVVDVAATLAEDFTDENGHGTHTAGIVAANRNSFGVTGLAYDAKILPVKLANLEDVWTIQDFAELLDVSIRYAADNGADVISMSLGGGAFEPAPWDPDNIENADYQAVEAIICSAVDYAVAAGAVVIASAGNDYEWGNYASVPANCANTFSVGSVGPNVTVTSPYSTTDPGLDLVAPGETIVSTYPTNAYNGYAFQQFPYVEMSGTSMSAPMVAAAAALYLEENPAASVSSVVSALRSSATDMTTIVGFDPYTGWGLLDAAALVGAASARTTLAPEQYLRLISLRDSNNFSGGYTFVWDAPLGSELPDKYILEVLSPGSETPLFTTEFDGTEVRGTAPPSDFDGYSYYVLTADYGGTQISSIPGLWTIPLSGGGDLTGVSDVQYGIRGSNLWIAWDPIDDPDVAAVQILINGYGVDWTEVEVTRDLGGNLPNSVEIPLTGIDPLNSDMTIDIWTVDESRMSQSITSSHVLYARAPLVVSWYENLDNRVLRVWAEANRAGCATTEEMPGNCVAKRFGYQVQYKWAGSRSNVWRSAGRVYGYLDYYDTALLDNVVVPDPVGRSFTAIRLLPIDNNGRPIPMASPVIINLTPVVIGSESAADR